MIDRIKALASFMNVTAAESDLSEHLYEFFLKKGFSVDLDQNGSVVVRIPGLAKEKRKIMVCTPIDISGYICLYRENKTSFLTKTKKDLQCAPKTLLNNKGEKFTVKESKYDKNEVSIVHQSGLIGDVYRTIPFFEETNRCISGENAARYALIDLLTELSSIKPQNDVLLSFTTGFYSFGTSEANITFCEKPDDVFMLGFSEDSDRYPLLYVKNGKNFASNSLLSKAQNTAKKLNLKLKLKVSETEATKEASVLSASFCEVVSLGLPYKKEKAKEMVSYNAIEDLRAVLFALLEQ